VELLDDAGAAEQFADRGRFVGVEGDGFECGVGVVRVVEDEVPAAFAVGDDTEMHTLLRLELEPDADAGQLGAFHVHGRSLLRCRVRRKTVYHGCTSASFGGTRRDAAREGRAGPLPRCRSAPTAVDRPWDGRGTR